ncbi:MAG: BatA domain-containing protein [Pirellulales bacterium]|nr:BatA domain-containing protein [Pirellulales bacterium]
MSFLQPMMLAAMPLVALPLIIHLINQRRYQTMRWAAMMFLLAANRMSRGYARLRQWLIMLFRMLAIAGLIFAVSRPLASGWLGMTSGGRADTTILLFDRSPSMQQQGAGTAISKLETGRNQLVQGLKTLGSSHWVLIESTTNKPRSLESPDALFNLPDTEPASMAADLPAMLRVAYDYIKANQTGRTEIWICSDLRENDWKATSGQWRTLRDRFMQLPQGVRFHLLAYPQTADNIAVRVTGVQRREIGQAAELLLSLKFIRQGNSNVPATIPVQIEMEGARSEMTVEITGPQYEMKDCRIPLESGQKRGWGRIAIPADSNPADNVFYFAFDQPSTRQTIVVADDPQAAEFLQLAASIGPDPSIACAAEIVPREQLAAVAWDRIALLLWEATLPEGEVAERIESYVHRGGQVIFLPPRIPDSKTQFGMRWEKWIDAPKDSSVEAWRGDHGLLAHTQSGAALPVGQLQIHQYCHFSGKFTSLATMQGGIPLLARVPANPGGIYFCATTPAARDSSLATSGVVFYVAIQRALADGSAVLANARQLVAGPVPAGIPAPWTRLSSTGNALSTDYSYHHGVYAAGDRLLAVNRALEEDHACVLDDAAIEELFQGLDFARVDDHAGNVRALIQEVWRLFLFGMLVAMIVEAALCLPKIRTAARVAYREVQGAAA